VFHSDSRLTWDHAIIYFDMHIHFQMLYIIPDPLSFVLNRLPSKKKKKKKKKKNGRPKVSCIWSVH
ncbi:uncharacterized protein BX663DRAFT_430079, partial [Cokeromyces recurvatus]|uniref:uncharacterized protein n=1 Tax=Cokeromyces recurvatus TaxID=90255 RepID=UPI00221E70CC